MLLLTIIFFVTVPHKRKNIFKKVEKAISDEIVCECWKLTGWRWIASAESLNVCWKSWSHTEMMFKRWKNCDISKMVKDSVVYFDVDAEEVDHSDTSSL